MENVFYSYVLSPGMKRFSKHALLLVTSGFIALAIDNWNVTRKAKLFSNSVSQIGGRNGSSPVWPLGTEYRITLTAIDPHSSTVRPTQVRMAKRFSRLACKDLQLNPLSGERCQQRVENASLAPRSSLTPEH